MINTSHFAVVCAVLLVAGICGGQEITWKAAGKNGAVATGGKGAAAAGLEILKSGGNAADAAAATMLALSVTDSDLFCFGSEAPIIVYDAKRKVVEVICGQGGAPRLATREYFARKGGIPKSGVEAAAVPGFLDACLTMLDRYGTKRFEDVVTPTLKLLDQNAKPWHGLLAKTLRRLVEAERGSAPDRARGLRLVADYFYRGPIARELDEWCSKNGGLIRYVDLATHATRIEEPVVAGYRGHRIYKCGPWTQGPYALQTMQLLEGFDLKGLGQGSAASIHLIVESMKLALADRDVYYADPSFVEVPLRELLAEQYVYARRGLIDPRKASLELRPGDPRNGKAALERSNVPFGAKGKVNDTTTCLTADRWGNVVAATPSGWSGVQAGETGIWLGSRLQSLNIWEGHPNCIEPGKRPRITLTPTLVMKDGKPVLAISVAGGDAQDQATIQMLTNYIDFGLGVEKLVTTPRYTTDHMVGSFGQTAPVLAGLNMSEGFDAKLIAELKARGHKVKLSPRGPGYDRVVIEIDAATGEMRAAGDPNSGRHAVAD